MAPRTGSPALSPSPQPVSRPFATENHSAGQTFVICLIVVIFVVGLAALAGVDFYRKWREDKVHRSVVGLLRGIYAASAALAQAVCNVLCRLACASCLRSRSRTSKLDDAAMVHNLESGVRDKPDQKQNAAQPAPDTSTTANSTTKRDAATPDQPEGLEADAPMVTPPPHTAAPPEPALRATRSVSQSRHGYRNSLGRAVTSKTTPPEADEKPMTHVSERAPRIPSLLLDDLDDWKLPLPSTLDSHLS
ncbi:hypothetical protein VTK73DRAFT_5463 [Phialemonium thermophilum]|uniref:Transmembrane protein n=1 Tax=Phialemonium thermophilum TaxID=223376 RepID=A0ABR3WNI9_9PEZI